jgi:hypothetical protein
VLDTELYAEAAAVRCGFYSRTEEDWQLLAGSLEVTRERAPDLFDPANPAVVSNQAHIGNPAEPKPSESLIKPRRDYLGGRADDYWQGHDGDDE